ncbi:NAD(P)-binding protein [Aspergillus eucalypticola CBS 122712]|uniref:NAD(P)-binding protein n=1 Tax=Aspergillus eucalypticola (strain CBS 122712 / IBT 29274) TaxID=1448314 RepID=A0A317UT63_ASPEC|nr:NAD(P)-binding protein [Aspergillus eucalypticola CBS 122712]PWY64318.1 NAD(P)-binding protein [Aspergillus eucalypticola CBS 122712]
MSPQIILVVGASRGIGRELVKQLSVHPNKHIIASVRQPAMQPVDSPASNVSSIILDQANPESVIAAASQIPELDTLVINGAFAERDQLLTCPSEKFDTYLDVNVKGPLQVVRAFLPALLARQTRQIVLTSSSCGSMQEQSEYDHGSLGPYSVAKAAGNMMMIQLHHELRDQSFTCAAFHPGWVATDMGGPGGMPVEESVAGYVKALEGLRPDDSPKFVAWNGSTVPW